LATVCSMLPEILACVPFQKNDSSVVVKVAGANGIPLTTKGEYSMLCICRVKRLRIKINMSKREKGNKDLG